MNYIILLVLLVIDLIVFFKLLEEKPTPPKSDPNPISGGEEIRATMWVVEEVEEPAPTPEELKERFRVTVKERRKAWEESFVWNEEDNLYRYREKHGLISAEELTHLNKSKFSLRLFSF